MVTLGECSIVRISHVFDPHAMHVYPGDPLPHIETVAHIPTHGFYLQHVSSGEHTGTHWGSPIHFNAYEAAADQLTAEDFLLPAVKIDIRDKAALDADYALTMHDVDAWQHEHGEIPQQCAILLHTGWDKKWSSSECTPLHHPGFSPEVVTWFLQTGILGEKGALGTDAFSPDVGCDTTFQVSHLLYRKHRISLELLAHLDKIPPKDFYVLVGGNIHKNGSGSPAAIYALF